MSFGESVTDDRAKSRANFQIGHARGRASSPVGSGNPSRLRPAPAPFEDRTRHVRGVKEPLDLEERLANLISDHIVPRLVPELEIVPWRRSHVLAIQVYASPVRPHYIRREGLDRGAASVANRRFLHSRLTPGRRTIEEYRLLVADAIYPDKFSKRRVSIRDAAAAIVEYRRSTGDAAGTIDLMLTFVEAETEQAADLGYGDEAYFNALQIRLDAVAKEFDTLPADVRAQVRGRLGRIRMRAQDVGWGFSDAVDDVLHALDARAARVRPGKVDRR